jgi:hypothetical protein
MEVHTDDTDTRAGTAPATYQPKLIEEGERNGLKWRVMMHGPSVFRFDVRDMDTDILIFDDLKNHPNAGKAGRAAEDWCREEVARRYAAEREQRATEVGFEGHADAPPEDWVLELPPAQLVGGWSIQVLDDGRGTYKCDVINESTGEYASVDFVGYVAWGVALGDAVTWARHNPCDGSEPVHAAPTDDAIEVVPDAASVAEVPAVDAVAAEVPARTMPEDDELVRLRQQLAAQGAELESAKKQLAGVTADICEAGVQADEATALLLEIRDDEAALKVLKDELKAKKGRFDLITGKMASHVQAVIHRKAPPAYQLTLASDKATRDGIGADDAEKYAEQLNHPEKWAYNGKEYTIDVEPLATGGYSAWLRGHRAATEAPHENLASAVEEAKNRAALLLKDAEPGEGLQPEAATAVPASTATAAEVKLPPKAGGKLKGRDRDGVIAVLKQSKSLVEALEALAVTNLQLTKFCKKADIDIGRTINTAEAPELPPAPDEKVPARGRGGKRGSRNGRGK